MKRKYSYIRIIPTILMAVFMIAGLVVMCVRVSGIAEKDAYKDMSDIAAQLAVDTRSTMERYLDQTRLISSFLSEHKDMKPEETQEHLRAFEQDEGLASFGILSKDGEMLLLDGKYETMQKDLDFETEVFKAPYISDACSVKDAENEKYIYLAVPIGEAGDVTGILYGILPLNTLKETYMGAVEERNTQVYIVDSTNGDFLVDTWHNTYGNVYDDQLNNRETKDGSSFGTLRKNVEEKKTGFVIFRSETADTWFYSYYMPLEINEWMLMVTMPEEVVLSNARQVYSILYWVTAGEILAYLLYSIWIFLFERKQVARQKQQLRQTLYMYDVQQILFDVHKNPEQMENALQKVAKKLKAENAKLICTDGERIQEVYEWPVTGQEWDKAFSEQFFARLRGQVESGNSVLWEQKANTSELPEEIERYFSEREISSLAMAPVLDSDKKLIGVLCAVNAKNKNSIVLLECVARSFMMAVSNLDSYRLIHRMGTVDELTGLLNRNSYEHNLELYAKERCESLCCIYMDVNGLHEMNNTLGHAAGDEMLRTIGQAIAERFGKEHTYRIGGDEMVVFCFNCTEAWVNRSISNFKEEMQALGYHISVGSAWKSSTMNVEQMLAKAEALMYEEKNRYYQEKGDVKKSRLMNYKLEQMLVEKKDTDMFLSIIAHYFFGVYVVDLCTDKVRIIYEPPYFASMLDETDQHFKHAFRKYIDSYVAEEEQERFYALTEYENVETMLENGEVPELAYRRKDGAQLIMRIYRSDDYTEKKKETFWLFEPDRSVPNCPNGE